MDVSGKKIDPKTQRWPKNVVAEVLFYGVHLFENLIAMSQPNILKKGSALFSLGGGGLSANSLPIR